MSDDTPQINENRFFAEWMLTFVGFPLGGIATISFVGPMNGVLPAALGGALAGALVGAAQLVILRRHLVMGLGWILSTISGLTLGNTVGFLLTGGGAEIGDLLVIGLSAGVAVGLAQWSVLREYLWFSALWPPVVALSWPLSWAATWGIGMNLTLGYPVFDPVGGLVFTALSGGALLLMIRKSNVVVRIKKRQDSTEDALGPPGPGDPA